MATEANIGWGTIIRVASPEAPAVFTAVAEVTSITPPPMTRDIIDASHMQSPDRWREFISGMKDGGEISIDMNFIVGSETNARMLAAQTEEDPSPVEIEFVNGSVWSFMAFCSGYEPDVPFDDKMTATATFKVTGAPTFDDPS